MVEVVFNNLNILDQLDHNKVIV